MNKEIELKPAWQEILNSDGQPSGYSKAIIGNFSDKKTELKPCREAFEAWAALGAQPYDIALTGDDKYYVSDDTQNAWLGWQAAQAQLQAENARLRGALGSIADSSCWYYNDEYSDSFEDAYLSAKETAKTALQHNEAEKCQTK